MLIVWRLNPEESGLKARQKIIIKEGLDSESAKKITKLIKEKNLKFKHKFKMSKSV